ncbi:MAG TPA: hypothetical protein VL442_13420 [Mucilaginibacter sp.]|jgi:hypothetical protein|nr:hypothetical protein [Mucilaginibacter sp.]
MKRNLKKAARSKLGAVLLFGLALFVAHSCKKAPELNEGQIQGVAPSVVQAKGWYENNYPRTVSNNANTTTQGVKTTNAQTDMSQIFTPDWRHNATYRKLGKDVIEMPALTSNISFGLLSSVKKYNKAYTRASFLILKDGEKYNAYLMMVVADSDYVRNDLSKLMHNTYRKYDNDFSGMVLYFTPKGKFLRSYVYKNGKNLEDVEKNNVSNSTQKTNAIEDTRPKSTLGCIAYYWVITYPDGSETWDYLYTLCEGGGGGGGGGSTAGGGSRCIVVQSLHRPGINSIDDPPADGGGGFPDPTTPPNCTTGPLDSIMNPNNTLTAVQKEQIDSVLQKMMQDCLGKALYNYMRANNKTFTFIVNSTYPAPEYNPTNGSITIPNTSTFNTDGAFEELFHSFQNFNIPGGTSQYGNVANSSGTITSYTPGGANIEFEQKVLHDMQVSVSGVGLMSNVDASYTNWIADITNDGKSYPKSFTPTQLNQYNIYMARAVNPTANPGFDSALANQVIDSNLQPTSMFSLINLSPCATY